MPIAGLALLLLNAYCIIHAARNGKNAIWYFAILGLPVIGALAYIFFEILPQVKKNPETRRKIKDALWAAKSPEARYDLLASELKLSPTVNNRVALAEECLRQQRYNEAIVIIKFGLTGLLQDDPLLLSTLAEAQFQMQDYRGAVGSFERLRAANPDWYRSGAHLLFARSLEQDGRETEALEEYRSLAPTYPGQEARWRYAALLAKRGYRSEAAAQAQELAMMVDCGNRHYKAEQQVWRDAAERFLAEL